MISHRLRFAFATILACVFSLHSFERRQALSAEPSTSKKKQAAELFADSVLAATELVLDRHIDSPTRQRMIYAAAYDGMQGLMAFLTENCCRMDAQGCSSDCPEPLPTKKTQKRTLQKTA